jgi:hypothetical protein
VYFAETSSNCLSVPMRLIAWMVRGTFSNLRSYNWQLSFLKQALMYLWSREEDISA